MDNQKPSIKKHPNYDNNPLRWLKDSWRYLMNDYLWIMWLILSLMFIIGHVYNTIDISALTIPDNYEFSVSVIVLLPLTMHITKQTFKEKELYYLFNSKMSKHNGFLTLFAPHVFTGVLYVLLGLLSFAQPSLNPTFNLVIVLLQILGLFSLFNVFYNTLNDLYYTIVRMDIHDRIDRMKNQSESKEENEGNNTMTDNHDKEIKEPHD